MRLISDAGWSSLILLSVFLMSCSPGKKEELAYKQVIETLQQSAEALDRSSEQRFREFSNDLNDATAIDIDQGKKYASRMLAAKELRKSAVKQIDSLEAVMTDRNYAGINEEASRIFLKFKGQLPAIDSQAARAFQSARDENVGRNNYTSLGMAQVYLNELKTRISLNYNSTIAYLQSQVALGCGLTYSRSQVLVGQSSTVLEPGQLLEIQAGVGNFSAPSQPKITIANNRLNLSGEPHTTTKIKVPTKPGNYSTPVEIDYLGPDGKEIKHRVDVKYRVVKVVE
ncbi:MAG: hypothetical protein EOO46_09005 [Flavobacterium sp.]|nr:MAG: hypothetical protein EOO46_09005 [Flavobacterium sp.]